METTKERRWKQFCLDRDLFYGVLEGRLQIMFDEGVTIINNRFDLTTFQNVFIIEHPDYEDLKTGAVIPEVTFPMRLITD